MSLEQYLKQLLGDQAEQLRMEIEPAFRFELPLPEPELEVDRDA